ncbi:YqfQ family protein [Lederbergia sp. NSJ-179]|uniref:YqfQ family protein n=1 Tax=Lederbergia sp. NSJ-179 TaxID=2931402 RepID=UPI001FD4CF88|nr:YqfQ family protein [Lederbergia sp. NSJ-179]MCJ7841862.1 YqfQ family protein [Lederbergia sp. NSJ-179]
MALRNPGPMMPQRMGWPARNIGQSGLFGPGPRGTPSFGQQPNLPANRGLLARLFSRQAAPEAASMFARGGGTQPSFLQGITNPQTIGNFLGKTQNVLNTAQQIGPLIQQYGPIVKNLPAMWKIYQGLTSSSGDEESKSTSTSTEEQSLEDILDEKTEEQETEKNRKVETKKNKETGTVPRTKERKRGESVPKLYIP